MVWNKCSIIDQQVGIVLIFLPLAVTIATVLSIKNTLNLDFKGQ